MTKRSAPTLEWWGLGAVLGRGAQKSRRERGAMDTLFILLVVMVSSGVRRYHIIQLKCMHFIIYINYASMKRYMQWKIFCMAKKKTKIIFKNDNLGKIITTHIIDIGLISSIHHEALAVHEGKRVKDIKIISRKGNNKDFPGWEDAEDLEYKRNASQSSGTF